MIVSICGDTNVGKKRNHNEDSFVILYHDTSQWNESNTIKTDISGSKGIFFAVADGMGGANAGEIASSVAVETIRDEVKNITIIPNDPARVQKILESLVYSAHNKIVKAAKSKKERKGMGTTLVLGWIINNMFYVVWSGDSRCYHYRKGRETELHPFTEDHSLVWSRVQQGELTAEEARVSDDSNLILQALGDVMQSPKPGFRWSKLDKNDRILLCSDGLNSMLSDTGIQQIMDYTDKTQDTCHTLINTANNAGGYDNITVILVDILKLSEQVEQPPVHIAKPKRKRKFKTVIGLLIAGLIITGLLLIEKRYHLADGIKENIKSFTNSNPDLGSGPEIVESKDKVIREETKTGKKSTPSLPSSEAISSIDTTLTIKSLKGFLKDIEVVRNKILYYRDYEIEFYSTNEIEFRAILRSLDSINTEIHKVADIKDDNSSTIINGKVINEKYFKSIQQAIKNLNIRTEGIITSQNEMQNYSKEP